MIRMLALVLVIASCETKIIDLGIDGAVDGVIVPVDASTCACRITPCRAAADCALIGGACGPDFYCVGSFGSCSTDSQCQATSASSVCTKAADSIVGCQ
jgi:hypothetical protein